MPQRKGCMSEANTTRVQRWREAKRQEGKEALTIWLSSEEKLRLEELARTWHTSISAMISQALAGFHPDRPAASAPDQLRQMIREEITHSGQLQQRVREAIERSHQLRELIRAEIECYSDEHRSVTVAPTSLPSPALPPDDREAVAPGAPLIQKTGYGEIPAAIQSLLTQRHSATASELAKMLGDETKAGTKKVWQALQRMLKRGAVLQEGKQYRLPEPGTTAPGGA